MTKDARISLFVLLVGAAVLALGAALYVSFQ